MKKMLLALALTTAAAPAFADEPDGLKLPKGFHAQVVADGLGSIRHLALRGNDIYVSTQRAGAAPSMGVIALRLMPDHTILQNTHFGSVDGGTGIRIHNGALYVASGSAIYRFALDDALAPKAAPETMVDGLPGGSHPIAFDGKGNMFVSMGGGGNICTDPKAPKDAKPVGLKPCPLLEGRSGVWRFSDTKTGQTFADGEHYATGIRNMSAMDWRGNDALYGAMHGRDATHNMFPDLVSASDDDAIGDEMHRMVKGTDFGWPYSYYDGRRKLRLVSPEYGGNGKTTTPGDVPVASFQPMRPAPDDLTFYEAGAFPAHYRGGAFLAMHGGADAGRPDGNNGYDVVFVPFKGAHAGKPEVFAGGFAGPEPSARNAKAAAYRPVGVAVGPDGALYVADSNKGKIWRISYGK
jgi:glucose/arabinose dehydrogenase